MDVFVTCKYEEDLIKNEGARVFTAFSPLQPYGSYPLPWTPEFPYPNDGSVKISL